MKPRLSLALIACLLFVSSSLTGVTAQGQAAISEAKVLAILNSIDKATKNRNIAGIVGPMAKDVKIKLTIATPNKEQQLSLTRDQYAFYTRRGMQKRIGYDYSRKNVRVKIYEDGQTAMVTNDLYETLTMPEGTVRGVTAEVTILGMRGGKLVITSLEGRLRLY